MLRWEFTGSEIPDTSFRCRRWIRATSPDLESPLEYKVEVIEEEVSSDLEYLSPSKRRILAALEKGGNHQSPDQVQEATAHDGKAKPLKLPTVQHGLREVEEEGRVRGTEGIRGITGYWSLAQDRMGRATDVLPEGS